MGTVSQGLEATVKLVLLISRAPVRREATGRRGIIVIIKNYSYAFGNTCRATSFWPH